MTANTIAPDEFKAVIQTHIEWAAEWNGDLPADKFFGLWAGRLEERQTLVLTARIVEGALKLTAPPESPLVVKDNRIRLNGLELIINLQ